MKYIFSFLLLLSCCESFSQVYVNTPLPFVDSTNLEMIKEYRVDNFVCEDTNLTILEFDDIGRIKKESKYFINQLQEVITNIKDDKRNLYIKTIKEKFNTTKFQKAGIITHDYLFDKKDNIILETVSTAQDSVIEKTKYEYDSENRLIKITRLIVPKRFHRSNPPQSFEMISYDSQKNEKTIQKFSPTGELKNKKTPPIWFREKPPKNGESILTINGEYSGSKTRTVYEFHELGFWIKKEGYMDLKEGEGKLYTFIREVKFRK